jgi:hypothetical protein
LGRLTIQTETPAFSCDAELLIIRW